MVPNIGFIFLFLAVTSCFFQLAFVFLKSFRLVNINSRNLANLTQILTSGTFLFCSASMLCLIYAYVVSDFSVQNVYQNSHQLKPLIYKITGAWGNHEGSMLLLAVILSTYSLAFCFLSKINDDSKNLVLAIQSFITFGILSFIISASNPFIRIFPDPESGIGLNPILQDIGLAAHPPMLYTGYIGFSLVFSLAVAALLREKVDKDFAKYLRPWLTFSWSFLTIGIGLGSWWAYRELGWGGYWFWDAVENVSLMPWLCATALLHSNIVLQRTGNFKIWTIFLSILSFVFCLLGIFLVRSGILTSVHSFANDPDRGIFIIILFLIIGGFGFLVFALKAAKIKSKQSNADLLSRSFFILVNNFIFCLALFIVVLGTLYPIILQVFFDSSISVGAPYYASMMSPIVVLMLAMMIFVPALNLEKFKKFNKRTLNNLFISLFLAFVISVIILLFKFEIYALLAILFGLISIIFISLNFRKIAKEQNMTLAHIGFILIIIAICANSLFQDTKQLNMNFGDVKEIRSYKVKFVGVNNGYGKNYLTRIGNFEITDGSNQFMLNPESRYYPVADQNTSEAAIKYNLFSDLYLVLGEKNKEENFAVRIYYRPFISFIWIGCFLMFIAGMLRLLSFNPNYRY